jgi:ADP-heptose:LPS heptosyltransferase
MCYRFDTLRSATMSRLNTRSLLRTVNRAAVSLLRRLPHGPLAGVPPEGIVPWKRLLLVKLVGMGDATMIRTLAEHIARAQPDGEIGVLVGPATRDVMGVNSPFRVHAYDPAGADRGIGALLAKVREIRSGGYDLVLDFEQHILLVSLFLRLTGIPARVGLAESSNPRARFQTHTIPFTGSDSMWDAYVALARAAAPSLGEVSAIELARSAAVAQDVAKWWRERHLEESRVIAMHLGSGSRAAARRWPVERFARLAERMRREGMGDAVVLTGTPEETPLAEEFARCFSGHVADATALGSLERTAELLRRCSLMVSNDTGVMHLAAAMGTPTVGLFGPNTPQRYRPVGPRVATVYTTKVACSPCIQIHRGEVPECKHAQQGRCLLDIEVDTVLQTACRLLKSDPLAS